MAQTSFAILTVTGANKHAEALANDESITITEIAIGDGETVPSGGETELYNEVFRGSIVQQGIVGGSPNTVFADLFLEADDGPFTIWEAGLFDDEGDLIAIAHYDPAIIKTIPSSGQAVEGTIRIEIAFESIENVVIVVDPSEKIALNRLLRMPYIAVNSDTVTAPPADPALGDLYVVPEAATDNWAGKTDKLAEYVGNGVWSFIDCFLGTVISIGDRAVDHADYYQRKTADGWTSAKAALDAYGFVKLAPDITDKDDDENAVTPSMIHNEFVTYDKQALVNVALAYRSNPTDPLSMPSGVHTKVPIDGINNDVDGDFSVVNGELVCVTAGTYFMFTRCQLSFGSANSVRQSQAGRVTQNGLAIISGTAVQFASDYLATLTGSGSITVELAVDDTLSVTAIQSNVSALTRSSTSATAGVYISKLRET